MVQKVCEIFEYFQETQTPQRLKDIADHFAYPSSSVFSLLKSLVEFGYLEYDVNDRRYFPTMRMPVMTGWIEGVRFGGSHTLAAMRQLSAATLETVTLGAQSDLHAQYIHQIWGKLSIPKPRTRQTIRPLEMSGVGWLLLSAMDDEKIKHFLSRINYARPASEKNVDFEDIFPAIDEIRHTGYVVTRNLTIEGGMIGMLIPCAPGERQYTLSIHALVDRMERKQEFLLQQLRDACVVAGTRKRP